MQRGLDAEVAAKVQQQHVKEVSDQQWHLSIVREVNAAGFCSKLLSLISANQIHSGPIAGTKIYYEPSYNAFEVNRDVSETQRLTGRRMFGSFEPEIDVYTIRDLSDEDRN
jgi:hypothetical protein